jgi:alpha-beta hydrolase superfamily lysophospholipase
MRFFSGFSLSGEKHFFEKSLKEGDYTVAGFSYGAVKAAEYALGCTNRIDTLQLFSPAFFQSRPEKFRRLQLMAYKKDSAAYLKNFISNCFAPYPEKEVEQVETSAEELEALLYFAWTDELMQRVVSKGIAVEVYLGSEDKIIDSDAAKAFFLPHATVFYYNGANHFLLTA